MRSKILVALGSVVLCGTVAAAPAVAEAWLIHLKNGNTFVAKYRPVEADYDENKLVVQTEQGNSIAVHKDDIEEVVSDLEFRGFGIPLDRTTILVGYSANDASQLERLGIDPDNPIDALQQLQQLAQLEDFMSQPSPFDQSGQDSNMFPSLQTQYVGGSETFGAAPMINTVVPGMNSLIPDVEY